MKKYTKEEQLELIRQFEESGEKIGAFASKIGVSRTTIGYWIMKYRKQKEECDGFIPLNLVIEDQSDLNNRETIRIVREKITIYLPKGIGPLYIKTLLGW
jgi:transposase-like protein